MRKLFFIILLLCLLSIAAIAQTNSKLKDVRKIYVGDLGKQEGADLIREKLRARLMKSTRFSVAETPEVADAILTGAAGVEASTSVAPDVNGEVSVSNGRPVYDDPIYGPSVYDNRRRTSVGVGVGVGVGRKTTYAGVAALRLVNSKTEETIWTYELNKRSNVSGSPSTRVADKAVEQLLKDAK